jgi:hypothetical protein
MPGASAGVLTTNAGNEAGTIVYDNAILTDVFSLSFQIQLGTGDGGSFFIATDGPTKVGQPGGGLGIAGLHGYAIELDTFDDAGCSDPDADHVGLDILGPLCGQGVQTSFSTASLAPLGINLQDGQWHEANVIFDNGAVTVAVDSQMVISSVTLPGWTSGMTYWYGFSGSTGASTALQQVRNVHLSFPSARCL